VKPLYNTRVATFLRFSRQFGITGYNWWR